MLRCDLLCVSYIYMMVFIVLSLYYMCLFVSGRPRRMPLKPNYGATRHWRLPDSNCPRRRPSSGRAAQVAILTFLRRELLVGSCWGVANGLLGTVARPLV